MSVPALSFLDRCIFTAVSGGTGSFVVASAVTGYQAPTAAGGIEGKQYGYAAQSADLTQWEYGYGFWSNASQTLTRIVISNSLGTTSPINFAAAPNVLITQLAESIPLTVNVSPIVGGTPGKFLTTDMTGTTLIESDAHFPEATANIDFYISPAGNDSNPGTISQPFATHNRALQEAARFNWVFIFFPIIHQADGTYPQSGHGIQIGGFVNLFESISFVGNNANPQNVVIADTFELFAPGVGIGIGGISFSGVTAGSCVNVVAGTVSINSPIIFNDAGQTPFFNEGPAFTFVSTTITVNNSATNFNWFAIAGPGLIWFSHCTINLPTALTVNTAFFEIDGIIANSNIGVGSIILGAPTWGNFGGVTGTQLVAFNNPVMQTQNGEISDIPGSVNNGFQDITLFLTSFGVKAGMKYATKSGVPTTADLPDGFCKVIRDTSGGVTYLAARSGATVTKVALT